MLITNPPAYIGNPYRHFIEAGSRWSFSMRIPKDSGCRDHYLPYPFFLGYSSALLKRSDNPVEVKALDACALDFDEKAFTHYIRSYRPDILVTEVPTISFPLVIDIIRELREDMDFKVVITGTHVTALAKEAMNRYPFIDYCLIGEYELVLKELVECLASKHNSNLNDIKGLAFRRNGDLVVNERRELLRDLDSLPFPDRDDFPIKYYHDFEIAGKPCAQLITSRGCPAGCIFCIERHVMYTSPFYRRRNPEKIVEEMKAVKEKYGARQVYFDDETMTISKRHVRSICKEIINEELDLPWTCMGDITLDYDTLSLMAKTGCVGVKFGVETTNTRTLADVRKTFMSLEKVKHFVKRCKELGIWSHATYMIGLPSDRKEDAMRTIDFATKLGTDSAQFSIATPFPGTPFFELAKENGWLVTQDWTMYDGANYSVLSYPWLTKDEIENLHRLALKRYYKHAIARMLLSPRKVLRLIRARGLRYAYNKVLLSLGVTS